MSSSRRDISLILQRMRAFLLGREYTVAQRFEGSMAKRTQPPPVLPGGPAHKLFSNNYYKRDVRHSVHPPIEVLGIKAIEAKSSGKTIRKIDAKAAMKPVKISGRTPGQFYRFD